MIIESKNYMIINQIETSFKKNWWSKIKEGGEVSDCSGSDLRATVRVR